MDRRPYQEEAVKAARGAVKKHRNTLMIAATGLGKTAMSGFFLEDEFKAEPDSKALFVQNTEELLQQNMATVKGITGLDCSIVKAQDDDWSAPVVFASIQTLAREHRRANMPSFTHFIYDECHLAAAPGPQAVIGHAQFINPYIKLLGLTATPGRGDGKGLRSTFSNVCANYGIKFGVQHGFLVTPDAKTIELGIPLNDLPRRGDDADMAMAAELLDKRPVNSRVVDEWEKYARDRRTIAFATNVAHAEAMAQEWRDRGYRAEAVHGNLHDDVRAERIAKYKAGEIQILTNPVILTAGFDDQLTSCIVINRPMYSHTTFVQAVGRGLRKVDPEKFPGVRKLDCLILDFTGAAARHGTLDFSIDLEGSGYAATSISKYKQCPSCYGYVPSAARTCDLCGHIWHVATDASGRPQIITDFTMTEIDILNASPFKYVAVADDESAMIATAFTAWAGVFFDGVNWHAVGRRKGDRVQHIGIGTRIQAVATADDFLRMYGDKKMARKSKRWLTEDASDAQKNMLRNQGVSIGLLDFSWTKYRASAFLEFAWAKQQIVRIVYGC